MQVWFDVGAHIGQSTLAAARGNPDLTVYAFEPIPALAAALHEKAPANYKVQNLSVSDTNGTAEFYVHGASETSSLLPFDAQGKAAWGAAFGDTETIQVPTIRLDAFMYKHQIADVDYIKVDTQGHDLAVVRGLGERIKDVRDILVEVQLQPLYVGASKKEDVVNYMKARGFLLVSATPQTRGKEENLLFRRGDESLLV
jgi:FkbM family methyltransferase